LTLIVAIDTNYIVKSGEIRSLRKRLGLTQQELAELVSANRVTIARWETGVSRPTGAYLNLLKILAEQATQGQTKGGRRAGQKRHK
jgi:DNA-binding transcriptional regulator YiaG